MPSMLISELRWTQSEYPCQGQAKSPTCRKPSLMNRKGTMTSWSSHRDPDRSSSPVRHHPGFPRLIWLLCLPVVTSLLKGPTPRITNVHWKPEMDRGVSNGDMEEEIRKEEVGEEVKSHVVSGEPYQPSLCLPYLATRNLPRPVHLQSVPPRFTLIPGPGVQEGW